MKRVFIAMVLFWSVTEATCMAQDKTETNLLVPITFTFHNNYKSTGILFTQPTAKPIANYSFNYILPKGAIFCRMEDALHSHFNIWIKFRMGDDDKYSN